jgi:hypothetical protein
METTNRNQWLSDCMTKGRERSLPINSLLLKVTSLAAALSHSLLVCALHSGFGYLESCSCLAIMLMLGYHAHAWLSCSCPQLAQAAMQGINHMRMPTRMKHP